jgi:hypothetical protein
MLELWHPAIKGHLPPFKSWPGGATGSGFLTAHAKTTAGALAGGDAATFAQFAAAGAFLWLEGLKS